VDEGKKREKRIQVNAVERRGKSVVVEYVKGGVPNRKVVYMSKFADVSVEEGALERAPDYGVRWADALKGSEVLTEKGKEELEAQMRQRGIWTADDLRRAAREYPVVLVSLHREDTKAMIEGGK